MGVRSATTCSSDVDSDAGEERCSAGTGELSMMSRKPARSSFFFCYSNQSGIIPQGIHLHTEALASMVQSGCLDFDGMFLRSLEDTLVARQVGPGLAAVSKPGQASLQ